MDTGNHIMLKELEIQNFKSIVNEKIGLGTVNVFIGENGCGKSNILEALAFASASIDADMIDTEALYNKGVRVAKPSLFFSSFYGKEQHKRIRINLISEDNSINCDLIPNNIDDIFSKWRNQLTNINSRLLKIGKDKLISEAMDLLKKSNFKDSHLESNLDTFYREIEARLNDSYEKVKLAQPLYTALKEYLIFNINTNTLRGLPSFQDSRKEPLGINGENLDILIANLDTNEMKLLKKYSYLIPWLEDFSTDTDDTLKAKGYKLNRSTSTLFFTDKFMMRKNNVFSTENANEGILHVLFYLALTISKKTPKIFAIDNIESCLNPHLCRELVKQIVVLAKKVGKQILITTHNPAILDGLNLNDEETKLFEVFRNDLGYTKTNRIKFKKGVQADNMKLSELWMKGYLGAISKGF